MVEFLIKLIGGWDVAWQFFFVILFSGLLTQITCVAIKGFTHDFMHVLAVLIRGWPSQIDTESDEENNNEEKN
jgi:hypothetical protein